MTGDERKACDEGVEKEALLKRVECHATDRKVCYYNYIEADVSYGESLIRDVGHSSHQGSMCEISFKAPR